MEKKIVAFVEPSFYGVSFAKAAFELGHKVISIVSSLDNPKKYGYEGISEDLIVADIKDVDSVYNAIKNSKYYGKLDALVPATDYASHITAKVAEMLGLRGVSYEAALKARNKDLAREAYKEHGVPSAKFKKVKGLEDAIKAVKEIGYPVVIKPTNCASSQNVFFVDSDEVLKKAADRMNSFKETYMGFKVREEYLVEEYIEGQEFSVEIFQKEEELLFATVTEKITSPLPFFVEYQHILPTSVYVEEKDEIIKVAVSAARALGIKSGPSHVEVKMSKTGPRIIEVNGRPGGDNISSDLLPNALGIDVFKATVQYYLDTDINITPVKQEAASVIYLVAEKNGIVSRIDGLDILDNNENIIRYDISVKPGDVVKIPESSDDRLGYIIVKGKTPNEAKKNAKDIMNKLKIIY
ncbi:MAG: ATP-grasp domain-containing protein [Clostridium sp.]|nr:ATP-grasp domain-containing protein [Clostridium sp.]